MKKTPLKSRIASLINVFSARVLLLALAITAIPFAAPKDASAQAYSQYYPYPCYNFSNDLQIGSSGTAVESLHSILAREGFSRNNSWSISNQLFNEETASLVSGFQERYASEILTPAGLRYGTGFVGSRTRAKLNSLCGGGGGTNSFAPVISNLSAPATLQTNQTGTWSLTATDPQNRQLTYYVQWGDEYGYVSGSSGAVIPSTSPYDQRSTFTHAYATPGTYTVIFRVRNSLGYESQTTTTVYVTGSGSNNNTDGITISVSPTKYSYAQGEAVTFNISARNNTAYAKTLSFNSGCQTSYSIGTYNSANNQACTLMMTSVLIPAYDTHTWTVTHYPAAYGLSSGTYSLIGRVIGYGEASATISIESGGWINTNSPRVISPNGGEWLQKGSYRQLSWQMPSVMYFAAQPVDVYMVLQSSSQYPYTPAATYQQGYVSCPVGSTCAYNPAYPSYPYYPDSQYPYGNYAGYNTKYTVLQNTTLSSYNWLVGSTPSGWSTLVSGTYLMQVCLSGTTNCDMSDSSFTVY